MRVQFYTAPDIGSLDGANCLDQEETMRAVAFTKIGEPEVLRVMDVPDPVVGPGQVRSA
jgi:hypothetical protein